MIKNNNNAFYIGKTFPKGENYFLDIIDTLGKKENGSLEDHGNMAIIGDPGTGKSHTVINNIFMKNKYQSIFLLDQNSFDYAFEGGSLEDLIESDEISIFTYGKKLPNIIGNITKDNIRIKKELLFDILTLNYSGTLDDEEILNLKKYINNFLEGIIGNNFTLSAFTEYIKTVSAFSNIIVNKNLSIEEPFLTILNNDGDFNTELSKKEKVIFDINGLNKIPNGFKIISIIIKSLDSYLKEKYNKDKNQHTTIILDEGYKYITEKSNKYSNYIYDFIIGLKDIGSNFILLTQNFNDIPKDIKSVFSYYLLLGFIDIHNLPLQEKLDNDQYNKLKKLSIKSIKKRDEDRNNGVNKNNYIRPAVLISIPENSITLLNITPKSNQVIKDYSDEDNKYIPNHNPNGLKYILTLVFGGFIAFKVLVSTLLGKNDDDK